MIKNLMAQEHFLLFLRPLRHLIKLVKFEHRSQYILSHSFCAFDLHDELQLILLSGHFIVRLFLCDNFCQRNTSDIELQFFLKSRTVIH
jgi:hypothetical protein